VVAAGAEGVYLVDEHDRRGAGTGLLEQVPDPGGAHADEHLDEARAGYGQERDVGLAGDRAGQEGLAGAGRPGHQHAARAACAGRVVTAGVAQVIDDLADLGFHRGVAGHVGEPGGRPLGVDDPSLRPVHPAQPAKAGGLPPGAAERGIRQAADQQQRQQPGQRRQQRGRHGGGGGDLDVMSGQVTGEAVAVERDRDGGGERLPAGQGSGDLAGRADGHRADRAGADIGQEPGIGQCRARGSAAREGQQRHQAGRDSHREQPSPPRGRVRVAGRARLGHAHRRAPSRVSGSKPGGA